MLVYQSESRNLIFGVEDVVTFLVLRNERNRTDSVGNAAGADIWRGRVIDPSHEI